MLFIRLYFELPFPSWPESIMDNLTEAPAALWREAGGGSGSVHLQPQTSAGGLGETKVTWSGAGRERRGLTSPPDARWSHPTVWLKQPLDFWCSEYTEHYGKAQLRRQRFSFAFLENPLLLFDGSTSRWWDPTREGPHAQFQTIPISHSNIKFLQTSRNQINILGKFPVMTGIFHFRSGEHHLRRPFRRIRKVLS